MALQNEEKDDQRRKNIEISVKDIIKARKISPEFAREESELISNSENVFYKAREEKDFSQFESTLEKVIECMRKRAELL